MVRESQPSEGKVRAFPLDEPEPKREEENQTQDPQGRMTNMIKKSPSKPSYKDVTIIHAFLFLLSSISFFIFYL